MTWAAPANGGLRVVVIEACSKGCSMRHHRSLRLRRAYVAFIHAAERCIRLLMSA